MLETNVYVICTQTMQIHATRHIKESLRDLQLSLPSTSGINGKFYLHTTEKHTYGLPQIKHISGNWDFFSLMKVIS